MNEIIQGGVQEARYALQCFEAGNLGGAIQSIAAMQFLPSVDLLIDRDRIGRSSAAIADPHKILLSGWFTDRPEDWPPAAFLQPLITSFHLSREVSSRNHGGLNPAKTLLHGENLEYLIQHEPIGARDLSTRELLLEAGVEAYFSGSLSLTLGDGAPIERGDYICAVDLPPRLLGRLQTQARNRVVVGTHEDTSSRSFGERIHLATRRLSRYAHARCVVTTRLHCALPCLALGTPVLLIMSAGDKYRFSGLADLMHACLPQAFIDGSTGFNPDKPPQNPDDYLVHREGLIRSVSQFMDPDASDAARPSFPFVPDPLTESLLAPAPNELPAEARVDPSQAAFHQIFGPGRNYDGEARPDFLRDLGRMHAATGDLDEAARLLAIASRERPHGLQITRLLDRFKAKRPEKDVASVASQPELAPLVQDVLDRGLSQHASTYLLSLIEQAVQAKARGAEGDFVACGVALGGTAVCLASQLDGARKFLGFDCFQPKPASGAETAPAASDVQGDGSENPAFDEDTAPALVEGSSVAARNLASFGLRVDDRRIRLMQGPFEATLAGGLGAQVAFAYIDGESGVPVKLCLKHIAERLSRFGVVVVSGYDGQPECREAIKTLCRVRDDVTLVATQPHAILVRL